MSITDNTKAQAAEVLKKHAAELGISDKYEEAAATTPQQIVEIYNTEILGGQYGAAIPADKLPTVSTMEEANAFMSNFVGLPMPEQIKPEQLADLKAKNAAGVLGAFKGNRKAPRGRKK